jgi:hypothetical protein
VERIANKLRILVSTRYVPGALANSDARITFALAGLFTSGPLRNMPFVWNISNHEHDGLYNGAVIHKITRTNEGYLYPIGSGSRALDPRKATAVARLLSQGHVKAARITAFEAIAEVGRDPRNYVGQYVVTTAIEPTRPNNITVEYFAPGTATTLYGPNVSLLGDIGCQGLFMAQKVSITSALAPAAFSGPRRGSRCPCNSGKTWQRCHGRLTYPHALIPGIQFTNEKTGEAFTIRLIGGFC